MRKLLLLLLVGIALGYWIGWQDARVNNETIVSRLVTRVGGDHRANLVTDVDKQMQDAER
ncbi:MAG TPA: hypothetical protein VMM77_07260 [Gemmatimonadaceae bacterium]|nr:hypothetical protein [Gemmatimonadaceae bacterium]